MCGHDYGCESSGVVLSRLDTATHLLYSLCMCYDVNICVVAVTDIMVPVTV